eukprot:CAMPEP_0184739280 /NCGR_PEP_ID=MMETSP0315-20130426/2121_1 /TAXON_ID=101924 /ORGANISM="Rhodosorus marinus, Strain UTEX LB 2760" /LENGTH=250 /DNA_ID=CAMNT_0027207911 /DNA_START=78 /DNA_END=830 /DNA_ORIENTATION=+
MAFVRVLAGVSSRRAGVGLDRRRTILWTSIPAPAPGGPGKPPSVPRDGPAWGRDDGQGPDGMVSILVTFWKNYLNALERWPIVVKCVSGAVLTMLGDVAAQAIESKGKGSWDARRTFALTTTSLLLTTPIYHFVYQFLEARFPAAVGARNLITQVVLDQLIVCPLYFPVFFCSSGILEGKTLHEVREQILRDSWPLCKLSWMVYPFFQGANFRFVPLKLRTVTLSVVDFWFLIVMSMTSHAKAEQIPSTN